MDVTEKLKVLNEMGLQILSGRQKYCCFVLAKYLGVSINSIHNKELAEILPELVARRDPKTGKGVMWYNKKDRLAAIQGAIDELSKTR